MKKIIFLLAILFISCAPAKQLNRLRIRHPELFQSASVTDTVLIPGFSFDTTFVFSLINDVFTPPVKLSTFPFIPGDRGRVDTSNKIDTFRIEKQLDYGHKKSFKLQIVKDHDSLRVTGQMPHDTIYKTIPIETYKVCERKHLEDFVKAGLWVGLVLLAVFVVLFIFVFIKRNFL